MKAVIIGAGPAGTSCAIQLCKAGFDVTIIEKLNFPRFRPGESCHPGIEPLLHQLGAWEEIIRLNPLRYNSVWISTHGQIKEEFFNKDENWQGFQFPREHFDYMLLEKAISLGAKFSAETLALNFITEGTGITTVITNKGNFNCDFLIDATGTKSLSSIKLGLQRKKYSNPVICSYTLLLTGENCPQRLKSYFEIKDEYWGYIALISANTYSITYSSRSNNSDDKNAFIKSNFPGKTKIILSRGYETSWSYTSNHKFNNLYLIGDALMTFDPTSSKGILKSIMSGIYVAYLLENIKTNNLTMVQGNELHQEWGCEFFQKELMSIKEVLPQAMVNNVFV